MIESACPTGKKADKRSYQQGAKHRSLPQSCYFVQTSQRDQTGYAYQGEIKDHLDIVENPIGDIRDGDNQSLTWQYGYIGNDFQADPQSQGGGTCRTQHQLQKIIVRDERVCQRHTEINEYAEHQNCR